MAISLTAEAAFKLLAVGKVKIGWVVYRLREQVSLKRCFRCLEFGHIEAKCTGDCDKSKSCRKCEKEGHMFRECKAEPECVLCMRKKAVDYRHVAGSSRCPVFRKALGAEIHLNHCKAAQDLLSQTIYEKGIEAAIISEPYCNNKSGTKPFKK